ncbi:pyrophosphatase PpaX [Clostridium cellulovorans]|uniref:HAD-superfamily hydrolase, subfamily IA, variant 3 n=1 Tax=Clostridium cellulovorans (strain ATCC 35296 / DSM 3052 / OCM 3 / 743B) TaxID=573061 RepID=D9SRE0_CLOC7|nr:pyrophosphatase PpaX [Clostridium cellulovorans]ADL52369.1 HAD-superfamily hydrolase, subfamily IA, variant 3 [Clostridium cellulovorans 743B]
MIKAILFDLDGTILDTNDLILNSFKHSFKTHLDLELPREEIVKFFGEPLQYSLAKYGEDKLENLISTYRSYNEENHDSNVTLFKGVKEGLKVLKDKNFKLAIVTSKRESMTRRGLDLFGLTECFDVIITPEATKEHKPNGEPVLKACEVLGIKPEEAIMVGDSHNDILCGKNAGAKTGLVKYTALDQSELLKLYPDYLVDSIEEFAFVNDK